MKTKDYDVCIIGSGPAGLASLSAVREPYSLDNVDGTRIKRRAHTFKVHKRLKVCVIDANDCWLHNWKKNFETLDIEFLRSPALAHPDNFDNNALLAYAVANNRTDELLDTNLHNNNDSLRAKGQPQMDLWNLPSSRLFVDFCENLAESLDHDYVQGKITGITMQSPETLKHPFRVEVDEGRRVLSAKAVILATGPNGRVTIPPSFQAIQRDNGRILLWNHLNEVKPESGRILVIGGGLTAVQVALKLVKLGKTCVLCSRRPLIEKHFDVSVDWFEVRTANKRISKFYYQDIADRLNVLKDARGGGSVPPLYMRELEKAEDSGKLIRVVGEARPSKHPANNGQLNIIVVTSENMESKSFSIDQIVLACGIEPDCRQNPVVKSVLDTWPIPIHGGLPMVTDDLRWKADLPLYVVGNLGALNTGPDAGNLMGIRRAAQLVISSLECRCELREKVHLNPYEALLLGDSSDEDDSTIENDSGDESD